MKVIFDCRYTRLVRHDGISRYTAGLVEAFSRLHPVTMLINDEGQLPMLPDLPWVMGRPGTSWLEPFIGMLSINKWKPDVVFRLQLVREANLAGVLSDLLATTCSSRPGRRRGHWIV